MKLWPTRLLKVGCVSLVVLCSPRGNGDDSRGVVEGHLTILSLKEVDLAGRDGESPKVPPKNQAANYADYPLIVLTRDGKKEITRFTADQTGNYRAELPPGDYRLDVEGRISWKARVKPTLFTVVPNQTVHVDTNIDTGLR
jgi:hypothetical protein